MDMHIDKKRGRPRVRTDAEKKAAISSEVLKHYYKNKPKLNEESRRRKLLSKGINPDDHIKQQCNFLKKNGDQCLKMVYNDFCYQHTPK